MKVRHEREKNKIAQKIKDKKAKNISFFLEQYIFLEIHNDLTTVMFLLQ